MKAQVQVTGIGISIGLSVFLIALQAYAGGFDISGNGKAFDEFEKAMQQNRAKLQAFKAQLARNSNRCPRDSRDFKALDITPVSIVFEDGIKKTIRPVQMRFEKNVGSNPVKDQYQLTFLESTTDGLVSRQRTLVVDRSMDHENVIGIEWLTELPNRRPVRFGVRSTDVQQITHENQLDECMFASLIKGRDQILNEALAGTQTGATIPAEARSAPAQR